jgi:hypothetical protein
MDKHCDTPSHHRRHSRIDEKFEEFLLDKKSGSSDFRFTNDVVYTEKDLKREQERLELELREEKADTQRKIAQVAFGSMLALTCFLFTPYVAETKLGALNDLLGMFYISMATIVAAYFGFTTWMSKK